MQLRLISTPIRNVTCMVKQFQVNSVLNKEVELVVQAIFMQGQCRKGPSYFLLQDKDKQHVFNPSYFQTVQHNKGNVSV